MLTPLFYPESIAVLGVSRTPGKVGHDIVANLLAGGYAGRIIPVNPAAPEVLGLPCLAEIRKTKEKIDLCIIALPSSMVLESVRDCLEARAGAIAVISSGFKETGAEGAELQRRIAELCQSHKVPLLGPNCLGLINTEHRMNASFASRMPSPGCISVISQSGAICTALLDLAAARHTGIAKMVSMGNKADLNEGDLLIALAADPQTKVIIAYLEDIAC
ncbi:MAG: CoA-binding protein, partial [Desulfurivibrionaceae bacterium]